MNDGQPPTREELELVLKMAWGLLRNEEDPAWQANGKKSLRQAVTALAVIHGDEAMTRWIRSFSAHERHAELMRRAGLGGPLQ